MKILLVQPESNWPQTFVEAPSRALLILGTIAHDLGHEVKIMHLTIDGGFNVFQKMVEDLYKPDLVGITTNTFQIKSAKACAEEAKRLGCTVVVGGPHAAYWDGCEVDAVVVGEGEATWAGIISGVAGNKAVKDYIIPNYTLTDIKRFSGAQPVGNYPSVPIMASKGCCGKCTFCNTPLFWGSKVQYGDPARVLKEIGMLITGFGVTEIFFQDDTFNMNHEWATEIFERIIENGWHKKCLFKICCRSNEKMMTPEFLKLAREAGVWNIFFGVESGSQVMLDRMKKGVTVEEIERAVRLTKEARIRTQCSLIVGMPGETMGTLKETGELIKRMNPDSYGWCYAAPFPGTKLDEEVRESGHSALIPYDEYGYGMIHCRTDELSFDDLARFGGWR